MGPEPSDDPTHTVPPAQLPSVLGQTRPLIRLGPRARDRPGTNGRLKAQQSIGKAIAARLRELHRHAPPEWPAPVPSKPNASFRIEDPAAHARSVAAVRDTVEEIGSSRPARSVMDVSCCRLVRL